MIDVELFPNTGHHIITVDLMADPAERKDLDAHRDGNLLVPHAALETFLVARCEKTAWVTVDQHPYIRHQFNSRRIPRPGGAEPWRRLCITYAIETNLGNHLRGRTVESSDPAVPAMQRPPYAATDVSALPTAPVVVVVNLRDDRHGLIPESHRTLRLIWRAPVAPVPVDLVVDPGNSRLAMLALEDSGGSRDFHQNYRPLAFQPARGEVVAPRGPGDIAAYIASSLAVLQEPLFGSDDAECFRSAEAANGGRFTRFMTGGGDQRSVLRVPQAFKEISPVVTGRVAQHFLASTKSGEVTILGSPKRYVGAQDAPADGWRMRRNGWSVGKEAPLRGEILAYLGPAETLGRSAMMSMTALAIIEDAYRQIMSAEWRQLHLPGRPRWLRSILVTFPAGWPCEELKALHDHWQQAIRIFSDSRLADPHGQAPRLDMTLDEATASQLPIIYTQIRDLGGSGATWCDLYGARDGDRSSVRVMAIDVGGGTTDTTIIEYHDRGLPAGADLNGTLLFRQTSKIAGDLLLKRLIEGIVLPQFQKKGIDARDRQALAALFGKAANPAERRIKAKVARLALMPLVESWLGDLSSPQDGRGLVTPRTPSQAGCHQSAIDDLNAMARAAGLGETLLNPSEVFPVSTEEVVRVIDATFRALAESHARLVAAFACDLVILTGKPSELPQVQDLMKDRLPLASSRFVAAKGFAARWFPFSRDGLTIPDAKLTAVVGAALGRAIRLGHVPNMHLEITPGPRQRLYWGVMPNDDASTSPSDSEWILLGDHDDVRIGDGVVIHACTEVDEVSVPLVTNTTRIGCSPLRDGDLRQHVYRFRLLPGRGSKPVRMEVTLRRVAPTKAGGIEGLEILHAEGHDDEGRRYTAHDVELALDTIPEGDAHWLDSGEFSVSPRAAAPSDADRPRRSAVHSDSERLPVRTGSPAIPRSGSDMTLEALEAKQKEKIDELRRSHQEEIMKIKESAEADKIQTIFLKDNEIAVLSEKYTGEISRISENLKRTEEEKNSAKNNISTLSASVINFTKKFEEMEGRHKNEIKELERQHADRLERQIAGHAAEKILIMQEHAGELSRRDAVHRQEIERLQSSLSTAVSDLAARQAEWNALQRMQLPDFCFSGRGEELCEPLRHYARNDDQAAQSALAFLHVVRIGLAPGFPAPVLLDAVWEVGRWLASHFTTGPRMAPADAALHLRRWAQALTMEATGRCEIRVPQPGVPVDPGWMSVASGQRHVTAARGWAVLDSTGHIVKRAEIS